MQPQWSDDTKQADWILQRLPAAESAEAMPTGFAAYARLLHPIETTADAKRPRTCRWADLARFNDVELHADSSFWQVALAPQRPRGDDPSNGHPASDVLGLADATALAEVLRRRTEAPDDCWFGIWDGYGWTRENLVPPQVQDGPRVPFPVGDHLLYRGPVEAGTVFLPRHRQSADVWWPADRSWCVAGDIDENYTLVGGSAELIDAVVASPALEAFRVPAPPFTASRRAPHWLEHRLEETAKQLIDGENAILQTSWGTIAYQVVDGGRFDPTARWTIDYRATRGDDWASGSIPLYGTHLDPVELRDRLLEGMAALVDGT